MSKERKMDDSFTGIGLYFLLNLYQLDVFLTETCNLLSNLLYARQTNIVVLYELTTDHLITLIKTRPGLRQVSPADLTANTLDTYRASWVSPIHITAC